MSDVNHIVANVGIMPTAGGTVLVPLFYNLPSNGRITIVHASAVCPGVGYAGGTAALNLVDLGTSGTVVEGDVLWTLGSGGTMTVYDGWVPIIGEAVTPILEAGHWLGLKHSIGTAGTATIINVGFIKGCAPS